MSIIKSIAASPPVFRAFELLKVASGEIKAELLISNMCVVNWRNGNIRVPFDKMEKLCEILDKAIAKYEKALKMEKKVIASDVLEEVTIQVELAKRLLNKQRELLEIQREEKRAKIKPKKGEQP